MILLLDKVIKYRNIKK